MAKRAFFPSVRAGLAAGVLVAGLAMAGVAGAQVTGSATTGADAQGQPQETVTLSAPLNKTKKQPKEKEAKVVQSKDTKASLRKAKKTDPLAGVDAKLPDKQLYDKATAATKKGRFDVARLDLQTLLNTYPDSQYQMRAKLAIADSWYTEGGTAALTQAEQEYKDFITFFPNAPEAAEAQMRVGDIYFRQMDKPDRDYAKATHAEEEYRTMLQQFPESKLVPQAKQRLREVQEVLATREASIASFYSTRENWPATIARFQTVSDTYPEFSHTDDVLIGLGDAYEAEARFVRTLKMAEGPKAKLEKTYDDRAADAYRKVVLEHSAAAHVEDAKDRLAAMNLPIPVPTAEEVAASAALENSRGQYSLVGRAKLLVFHTPDTIQTAGLGDPSLADPTPTLAPTIRKEIIADFDTALNGNAAKAAAARESGSDPTPVAVTGGAEAPAAPAALSLNDVAPADGSASSGSAVMTTTTPDGGGRTSNSIGAEIVNPSSGAPALGSTTDVPRSGDSTGGLGLVADPKAAPLPPVEAAGAAPDAVNDVKPGQAPAAQTAAANGKNKKPEFDKSDESSSKHPKKKGLKKLNPL